VVWLLASVRLARFPYASMVAVSMGLAPPFSHLDFQVKPPLGGGAALEQVLWLS